MKRKRVLSLITALALCLSLCPAWASADDGGTGGSSCQHHREHTAECGYSEDPAAPCTFVCKVCPIEALIDKLPDSVTADNARQVETQLNEIYALYDELTEAEKKQVDMARYISLREKLGKDYIWRPDSDQSRTDTFNVSVFGEIHMDGHTLTWPSTTAIHVKAASILSIKGSGSIISKNGAGVEVESGGDLRIESPGISIGGVPNGLVVASGADVKLSCGTFSGVKRAILIQTEDGKDADFADLLEPGYAFFDANGNPVSLADLADITKKVTQVTVGPCTCPDHSPETYTHDSGATEHTWTCPYCATSEMEKCTFTFDENGNGECDFCDNTLTITVAQDSLKELAHNETVQPKNGSVTVKVGTGNAAKELTQDTDYTVSYETRSDVGSSDVTVTVTVEGTAYHGTFTGSYTLTDLEQPVLQWASSGQTVTYTGSPVEASSLPGVTINIKPNDGLAQYLQYSYRKQGETAYTNGLPTNAGTYNVVVSLPEMEGVYAVSSEPITLTINKLDPIKTAPAAKNLTYNWDAQELATRGELKPAAAADGAVILYATRQDGNYSTEMPTGVTVSTSGYQVWYKVEATENCSAVGPTQVNNVKISHRTITPRVDLSQYTYLYDGGEKQPTVTVTDTELGKVIPDTEYSVTYDSNKNVGDATVKVTNKANGNYTIKDPGVTVTFKITLRPQDALSITKQPDTVTYGDKFTLGTTGGSGSGNVTWKIIDINDVKVAKVDENSGQVTVTGHGSFTVQATKSGTYNGVKNYDDAVATWTVTAAKKPVVATVTAEDKTYDSNNTATVHAVVEQGVLPGDEITITGLTGTFSDENAGVGKTVTVVTTGASIGGTKFEHYDISYSSLTVTATINKAVADITTAPVPATPTYDGTPKALIATGAVVDPNSVLVEYALSENGLYSTNIPTGTDAGTYTVWYRVKETDNYTGLAPAKVDVTIAPKSVTPTVTLDTASYVYDGDEKKPVVTVKDGEDVIPESNYTVEYGANVNVGQATVTVTAKDDGNYEFTPVTATFEIKQKQAKVVAAPEAAGDPLTFNTHAQKLVTAGTASGGKMVYSLDAGETKTYKEDLPTGKDAKDYIVYYKVAGDGNHSDSGVGEVTVTIAPKTVKDPTIDLTDGTNPLVSYTYDGNEKKPTVVVKDGSTVIDASEYNVVYTDNKDAGKATVEITDKPDGNYTVTGSKIFVIVKADIDDPAPSAATITYDGKAHELLVPGKTSGGEVLYALNSPTSTYSAAIPTATEAGTYTVYYKVTGDKNHNDFAAKSVTVTIARKPLTAITIELSPESFAYDGGMKMPDVTVWDGKIKLPEEEYSWSCDVESPTNVGTYTITITDAANGNYDLTGVTNNTATFTIGQIAQDELVIGGKPAATNYGDSFQLTVSGGSGDGDVTWKADGPASVATDADGKATITINGVGEVTVTVEKDASTNHLAAEARWTFTAAPKPVEATVEAADKVYDNTTDATVASAGITTINNDEVTIDPTSITAAFDTPAVGAGKTVTLDTSKVKVEGADAAKYAISYPATVTADITQATTMINPAPAKIDPLTYNGQPQALVTAGTTNVGFIVYSLDGTSFSPEIPTGTDAKQYTVHYKVVETDDYTGVAEATITVTIAPKPITPVIEVKETSYLYDGTKKNPEITVKDGKTVIDEEQYTVTWAGTKGQTDAEMLTVADTYTATIKNVDGGNYTFSKTETVEIVAATQNALEITGTPNHVYYGDTVTTLKASGGSGNGTVTWSIAEGGANSTIDESTGKLTVKDTGSITVTAERIVPNYATVSGIWRFTVEPKPVTAEVTVADKVYDGTKTATVTSAVVNDLVDASDTITIDVSKVTATFDNANVGTNKTVNWLALSGFTITGDTDKYAVSIPATAQADITPKEVTVTVTLSDHDLKTDTTVTPNKYYIFDGNEKTPTVAVTGVNGDYSATLAASDYTVSITKNKNVGTADVTVTAKEGGNYTFADETVHFEIRNGAAVLTGTPQAKDLTYDGTAQDLVTVGTATGGTVVYSLTEAETVEKPYSETSPQGKDAGTYTVYYKVKGDTNHKDTAPGQVSVTIKPREITPKITLDKDSDKPPYEYDGTAKEPTVTVEGGVNTGDDHDPIANTEYTVSYQDNTNAGTAKVIVSDKNGGNYIVNGTATFEIAKAESTFTTTPAKKDGLQYNGTAQELVKAGGSTDGTVVYSVNGGNYSTGVPTASAVGTYTVFYKIQGDQNHKDTTSVDLTVEIAKNTVTTPAISLSSDQFTFNGGQQKPTVTVYDDNGLLIPENEYKVTITPTTGGSASIVDVGTYTVTVTTPDSSNYVITTGNTRTFEIVPANQETISITGTQAQVRYGDAIQLGITGGTGSGTVTWTVTGTDAEGNAAKSTISATGLLTVKDVGGPITVTAKRSAGGNYSDVSATWEFSAAKKPVTAVVTADDKVYDGVDPATTTVHVTWNGLVEGDTINTGALTGTFVDPNVGQNKTVKITGGPITDDKYDITIPATTTASILAVAATVDTEPEAVSPLTYNASQAQELVTAGTATGGIMVYSLDGSSFTPSIPKAKDAGTYTVYFKAQGDGNHTDSKAKSIQVTIGKQSVTPQVELTPSSAQYDGKEHKPTVTLRDGDNNVIPDSEYKVTYLTDGGKNWTDKGDYTVKIEDIERGNYVVATITKPFTISTTAQNPLTITNKPGLVYYGDTFTLSAVGGSGNGAVTWSGTSGIVEIDANGFVKIIGTGPAAITAEKAGDDNYETATATYPLNALAKPITAIVTADNKVYDGVTPATTILHVTWNGLVGDDEIDTSNLVGTFVDENVGTNKTVNISGSYVNDTTAQKYDITIPATTTASITKADPTVPTLTANDRVYDGSTQALVTGGGDNTRYSDTRDGVYSASVPTRTNAGTYTVWYKELGDANHNDSAPQSVTVTIGQKKLETPTITLSGNDLETSQDGKYSYVFDGTEKKPTVTIKNDKAVVPASEYTVTYSDNKNVGTATATITCNAGGNYTFDEQKVNFAITSAAAQLTSSPQAKDLTYTGQAQELVTVGTADGGHIAYLQDDGTTYSTDIPEGTNAGTYTVTYKVVGDGNYASGTETWTVSVTIKPREIVSPKVTVNGDYTYDGNPQVPADGAVEVKDGNTVIPNTEYTVSFRDNVEAGTATVIITNANGGNYIVNGTGTFTIGKGDASVGTAPTGNENLPYNGAAQALATAGSASGGTMVYSLSQTGEYSPVIPTGTAVGGYTVWYKVQGDKNHNDTTPASVTASIVVNTVTNPTVQVDPGSVTYNGKKQEPTVKVTDNNGLVIDGSEYTVTYKKDGEENPTTAPTNVGTYTLTITGKEGGNYTFTFSEGKEPPKFEILPADQTPLTITGTRDHVYYGDKIQLSTTGGNGTISWSVDNSTAANIENGLLTITGVGSSVTVTATSTKTGYAVQTATWSFHAEKKPVTAVVTAEAKTYNGEKDDAEVTATLQSSDLVTGDTVKIKLSGSFEDPNAGTNKKVTVDSTNPDFTGSTGNYGNYAISYPATTTASILKAGIKAEDVNAPTAAENLAYTGLAQALVEAGSVTGGTLEYSTDNITYSASLPTGTNADSYDVWYRVKGDSNHNDTAGTQLATQVTIAQQKVETPTIEFKPTGASYDGAVHKPEVVVKDGNGRLIPDSEYTVTYDATTDWTKVGKHKVKVANKDGGNYTISEKEAEFEILATGQSPLSITNKLGVVHYGDTFTLSAVGGSGTGTIQWEVTAGTDVAEINANGLVKVKGSGSVTITATKVADGNYGESTDTWTFSAEKRPAEAVVTAKDKEYDSTTDAELVITWKAGDLLKGDTITLNLTGKFSNSNVGDNKTVNITGEVPDSDKYEISFNTTTTASITPAAATVTGVTAKTGLKYTGQPQELVSEGSVDSGNVMYSLDGGTNYSLDVPKATNAGTYTVWYKAESSGNYADSAAAKVSVTIEPKEVTSPVIELSPESFDFDGSPKRPDVTVKDGSIVIPASEYTVGYSNNVATGTNTAKVTITDNPGGNYTVSGEKNFTIKAGNAALTSPPLAKDLTYDGTGQELVTDGIATNGKVVYRDFSTGEYSEQIPTAEDAGKYTVYYKVQSDNGTSDTAVRSITVTIKKKPVTPKITIPGNPFAYTGSAITPPMVFVYVDGNMLSPGGSDYDFYCYNNVNVGTASMVVWNKDTGNYQFSTTVTFEIVKEAAAFDEDSKPAGNPNLVYTGEAQDLIATPGTPKNGGIVVYSLDGVTYSAVHPTGTEVKSYTIYAKILGNSTYAESDVVTITAEIKQNPIKADQLTATLSPGPYKFTGSEIKPTVTLTDDEGNIIPADEYTVGYSNNINAGEATVTITSKGKNYSAFTKTVNFQITEGDKPALTITGRPEGKSYYGDTFQLSTTGGSDSGTVTWTSSDENVATVTNGVVTIKKSGNVKITATKAAATRDGDSANTATWEFYAYPKTATAIVTAKNKTYDNKTDVELTVTLSGLISGDSVTNVTAAGQFVDTSVGTQTVVVTLNIPDAIKEKYDIEYPATITATITAAEAKVTEEKAPTAKSGLQYTGAPLELVTKGEATGGKIKYSLDGETYTYAVPTGTDAKSYTVWYKVVADDDNYKDSKAVEMAPISIAPNTTTPTVDCKSATFTGSEQTPTVVVTVNNRTLPEDEYTVEVTGTPIAVGDYEVTVTDNEGGNYDFGTATGTFKIVSASQNPVSIVNKPASVCYGDTFRLSATGGSGNGAIQWKSTDESVATVDANGAVKVIGTGAFTVEAYRKGAGGYSDSNTDSVPLYADPKTVTPTVTAKNKSYDGNTTAELNAVWKAGDLVNGDTITLTIGDGTFETADAGTNKTVTFAAGSATGTNVGNYTITWPESTTASIYKVDAKIAEAPKPNDLTYDTEADGSPKAQELVTRGSTVGGIGTIVYSTSQNGAYSAVIPTGTTAGKYTVWYKVADSVNYTGIPAAAVEVEIKKADSSVNSAPTASGIENQSLNEISINDGGAANVSGKFVWKDGSIKPPVGESEQEMIFMPDDTDNYNTVTVEVSVTVAEANPGSVTNPSGSDNAPEPSKPSEIVTPSGPEAPSEPEGPSEIETPSEPVTPGEIEMPSETEGPSETETPGETEAPGETETPGETEAPSTPETPNEPEAPSEPETPNEPEAPSEPETPSEPVTPNEPEAPSEPETPNEPEAPSEPETPSEPVTPNEPEVPSRPNTPSEPSTSTPSEPSTPSAASAPIQADVRDGVASTVLNAADGRKLVEEAAANQSQSVVVKPEITGDVTKATVSIPTATVSQIESETDAALTVSTPIAGVILPRESLPALSGADGTLDVVAEQTEQGVTLTLTVGGETVEEVPGGLTLTVPVEEAGPGTVAVLVYADGTREVIQKGIVDGDQMRIPLSGSATVEIVDNGKDFDDVPAESWASDAVTFVTAHELFNGTSETVFSPDQPMSRGMLAMVLYNLEGRPEQETTSKFSDIVGDDWYAAAVSWTTAQGITNGYDDGRFGPDEEVTREQLAVMLWKYAGSPAASGEGLAFADADKASDYALEALRWAVEIGILHGYDNGQLDPGGTATRAQTAQLLKNFLESI